MASSVNRCIRANSVGASASALRDRAVSRLDEGLERSCPRCGMHTLGWSWYKIFEIDASGVDMVMIIACQWRHEAR